MIRVIAAAVLAVLVAGCGATSPTYRELEGLSRDYERGGASPLASTGDGPRGDACGIAIYRPRIGTPIANWEPPESSRVVRPGDAVTDDLRPERLNIIIDADGRVTSLECY
jgi:hypothetical protein